MARAKKKQWVQKSKEELRSEVQAALQAIESGVAEVVTGEDWKRLLKFAAKFHNYSFGNTMLIHQQMPHATRVAGFHLWKKVGRWVKAGEHGIRILAPMYKVKQVEDAETGEEETKRVAFFRLVSVFDVSQTDGDPLPSVVQKLGGRSEAADHVFSKGKAWLKRNKVGFAMKAGLGETGGFWQPAEHRIVINADNPPAHQARTLVHEIAHLLMHTPQEYRRIEAQRRLGKDALDRAVNEVEAESAAFVVMSAIGVPAGSYSFGYVAGWSHGSTSVVRSVATRVQTVATFILRDVLALPDPLDEARSSAGPDAPKKNPAALPTIRGWSGLDEIGYAIESGYWDAQEE